MAQPSDPRPLEERLRRLEEIARLLDAGDKPLDVQLKAFEEGMALAESCRVDLEQAELRVSELSKGHSPQ